MGSILIRTIDSHEIEETIDQLLLQFLMKIDLCRCFGCGSRREAPDRICGIGLVAIKTRNRK